MKKLTSLVLATGMVLSLAACGGSSSSTASSAAGSTAASSTAAKADGKVYYLNFKPEQDQDCLLYTSPSPRD